MKTIVRILLALAFAVLAISAHAEFKWQHFGVDPYASSRDEAMRTRESAFQKLGLPAPVVKLLVEATQKPGEKIRLVNGDKLSAMMSKGGVVHRDVTVAFVKPPVSGKMEYAAPAEKWQVTWQGKVFIVILPEICQNWSMILPMQNGCYIIPFDYRNTPGVVWDKEHRAHVSAHLDSTEAELESVYNDPCFGVVDADGFRKPFRRCEFCSEGKYPPAVLAIAVGLLPAEPKGSLSFHLKNGVGYFSFPPAWAARWMLYCVDTTTYPISISGYEGWQVVSRFDVVKKVEIELTLPKGTLDRTLSGAQHY